jgi:hypothetical protein
LSFLIATNSRTLRPMTTRTAIALNGMTLPLFALDGVDREVG